MQAFTRKPKTVVPTSLAIGRSRGRDEQQADQAAERVMRMPAPPLQRACPCGGGCPRCQAGQAELAHVTPRTDAPVLQRKPDDAAQAQARRERHIEELARDPADAHRAWKKLSPGERDAVADAMRRRFGAGFAQQFLDAAKKGKPQFDIDYYQPGSGPTPGQLAARGYRRGGMENLGHPGFEVEIWVHPAGKTVRRDVSTWKFGASEPGSKPGTKPVKPPVKEPPVDERVTDPPITTARHEQALDLLDDMNARNTALHALCEADPFNEGDAEDAEIEWNFSREAVRDFKDLDWSQVDPDFWKQVDEASEENRNLRAACCKRAPSNYFFDCGTLPKP